MGITFEKKIVDLILTEITAAEKRARVEVAREIKDHHYVSFNGYESIDYPKKCQEIIATLSEPVREGEMQ